MPYSNALLKPGAYILKVALDAYNPVKGTMK
jgi:hypothetical protein